MNPENINLNKYPIPDGYRLANSNEMERAHTSNNWMLFAGKWCFCSCWPIRKHWTYLVPITKRKGMK